MCCSARADVPEEGQTGAPWAGMNFFHPGKSRQHQSLSVSRLPIVSLYVG